VCSSDLELRVAQRTAQLRMLAVETTLVEARERQAIARDLHDDLGQILHVARIKLDTLAKLSKGRAEESAAEVIGLVAQASRMVRSLTSQLSPPVLKDLGLVPALRWLAEEMDRLYDLDVEIDDEGEIRSLSEAQASILFRSVRELLINAVRHARVGSARVGLRAGGGTLSLRVADDGVGIADVGAAFSSRQGFGLASVRERIRFLGGDMELVTHPGRGTIVTLTMPLESTPAENSGVAGVAA
jgi:signal transduction histidine kinase